MAVTTRHVIVGTTAVRLDDPISGDIPGLYNRAVTIAVRNNSPANTVYIGGQNVSPTNGWHLSPRSETAINDADAPLGVYAITASGSVEVEVMQVSIT